MKANEQNRAILCVLAITITAFIFNTTEFIPIALLKDISESFSLSESQTGIMITVYAWIVSTTSLPLSLLCARFDRKKLLISLGIIFVLAHILSTLAWNFTVLLISRAGVALAHAIYWSIAAVLVLRLAPVNRKNQVLAWLGIATTLSTIFGIPAGRFVAQHFGWKSTFLVIAFLATCSGIVLWRLLPPLPPVNAGSLKSLPLLVRRPQLMLTYLLVILFVTAHFVPYTYIEVIALNIANFSAHRTTTILLYFGITAALGLIIYNKYAMRFPSSGPIVNALFLTLCTLLIIPLAAHFSAWLILLFFWGLAISWMGITMQMRVLCLAPDATDVASSIFSSCYNIGIGAGALIGSVIIKQMDISKVGMVGSGIASLTVFVLIFLYFKYGKISLTHQQSQEE